MSLVYGMELFKEGEYLMLLKLAIGNIYRVGFEYTDKSNLEGIR